MQEPNDDLAQEMLLDNLLTSLITLSGVLKALGKNQQDDRIVTAAEQVKATLNQLSKALTS